MADNEYLVFRCLEVTQPIGNFYIGTMDFSDVVLISYSDIRRIEARDVEVFVGIERPLLKDRVAELRQFVKTVDASFPTSIILAVDSENAEYDEQKGVMRIRRKIDIAKIIDGQHRIDGLVNYEGPPFQLNVTVFVDMDMEDQAHVFATINLKQTKVSKSLAYDLYEFATSRSPQKTCHNIAKLLNYQDGSPFRERIKILGRATGREFEFLTQAAVVERLILYVSDNPMRDRDLIKRRKKLIRVSPQRQRSDLLIFGNMFIDERDDDIAMVVWNYFTAVAKRWPEAWNMKERGFVLNRSTGFAALMRLLPLAYLTISDLERVPPMAEFEKLFARATLRDQDFTTDRFKPGTSGEKQLFEDLRGQVIA